MLTTQQVRDAIVEVIAERRVKAQASQYDWKVCVGAVAAAERTFLAVPVTGSAGEYFRAVLEALTTLGDGYNDPDGEYTSGASEIGSIVYSLGRLKIDQG